MTPVAGRQAVTTQRQSGARVTSILSAASYPAITWAAAFLLLAVVIVGFLHPDGRLRQALGFDYATYMDAARTWLSGDGFYRAYQLAGPYEVVAREIMYPPTILPLLALFTALPAFVWWLVPIAGTALLSASVRGWRLAAILLILAMPWSLDIIVGGNPGMWIVFFLAAGLRNPGVAALVLLKPTLAPFALAGVRSRQWWLVLAGMAVVTSALLPLLAQYIEVIRNARWPGGNPLYSWMGVPLMLVPLLGQRIRTARLALSPGAVPEGSVTAP